MNCSEQTDYVNGQLAEGEYDDRWEFLTDAALGHAWGVERSSNPNDPPLWYDARSSSFRIGSSCETCSGWFGGVSVLYP